MNEPVIQQSLFEWGILEGDYLYRMGLTIKPIDGVYGIYLLDGKLHSTHETLILAVKTAFIFTEDTINLRYEGQDYHYRKTPWDQLKALFNKEIEVCLYGEVIGTITIVDDGDIPFAINCSNKSLLLHQVVSVIDNYIED